MNRKLQMTDLAVFARRMGIGFLKERHESPETEKEPSQKYYHENASQFLNFVTSVSYKLGICMKQIFTKQKF